MVGLTATSSKNIHASTLCPSTAAVSAPGHSASHCQSRTSPEVSKHSQASAAQSLVGLLLLSPGSQSTEGFVCALQASLAGMRIDFKHNWAPPTIAVKLLLCPWMWGMFFGGFQHFAIDRCSATSCKFSILTGKDKHMPFYSAILEWIKSLAVGKWTQFPTPVPSPGNLGVE